MKRVTYLYKNEKGEYKENVAYVEKSADVKELDGYVATTTTERAKHPTPLAMVLALKDFGVNLAEFYTTCEKAQTCLDEFAKYKADVKAGIARELMFKPTVSNLHENKTEK